MANRRIVAILSMLLLTFLALTSVAQAREPESGDDRGRGGHGPGHHAVVQDDSTLVTLREPQANDDHGQNRGGDNGQNRGNNGGNNNGQAQPVLLQLRLTSAADFAAVQAKAKFKSRRNEQELQVEIEHAPALAGQTLTVFVNGAAAGDLTITNLGRGRLSLNSQKGATVPAIAVGTLIEIKTSGGALVASGTF